MLNTRELIRRPGTMRTMSRSVTAPTSIGTDVISIAEGAEVHLEVRMESVVEGVLATGQIRSTATGLCVRCLDDIEVDLDLTIQELFAYPDRAAHREQVGDTEQDEDSYELDQDLMDLEPVVRDAVVTALPFQPVCREDCPGLCAQCGVHLADNPGHEHNLIDPRWSVLTDLISTTDTEKRT